MNKVFKVMGAICFCSMILASCGTIFGGSKYYAHVVVNNNTDAKIYYRDEYVCLVLKKVYTYCLIILLQVYTFF